LNPKAALGSTALISLSLIFAFQAVKSPVHSITQYPQCGTGAVGIKVGPGSVAACGKAVAQFLAALQGYQLRVEAAEVLGIVGAFSLAVALCLKGRPVLRRVAIFSSFALAVVYSWFALVDVTYNVHWFGINRLASWFIFTYFPTLHGFGYDAFLCYACASIGLLYIYGLNRTLRTFVVPGLLLLELGILAFDTGEMSLFAAQFATWTVNGSYLFSNWNVLFVASVLAILMYAPPLFKVLSVKRANDNVG